MKAISKHLLKQHVGRYIQVRQADGRVVKGKLVAIDNERVYIKPVRNKKGKPVTSNWIIGLFLAGIIFVGLFAWGWGGGGWGGGGCRGCCKPCCGSPCHRPCGCRRRRYHRRKRYAY